MKTVDVVIPTLGKPHAFTCLERLHLIREGKTWAEAANIGLRRTTHDVILMDDDVFINELTLSEVDKHHKRADVFGFKLLFPNGRIQHAGGIVRGQSISHIGFGESDAGRYDQPRFVCHATTSLVYIRRHVIDDLQGMAEDIPGVQMEDVDFSFRAIKAGYLILYLPQSAVHVESATKKFMPGFGQGLMDAVKEIQVRHLEDKSFVEVLEQYPKLFTPDYMKVEV